MFSSNKVPESEKNFDQIRLQIVAGDIGKDTDQREALVVSLTSITPGQGVTTVSLGLARSFQRASNEHVLLILAKETPESFESLFVGVKPIIIDDVLLSQAELIGATPALPPPYIVTPPDQTLSEEASERPQTTDVRSSAFEPAERARSFSDASDLDAPPPEADMDACTIIERFGGTRPMARRLNVPASTVASWKRRGHIPKDRRRVVQEIMAEELPPESLAVDDAQEVTAEQELIAVLRGGPLAPNRPTSNGRLDFAEIAEFFGGARLLAQALGFSVSTVNAWTRRHSVPQIHIPKILEAARNVRRPRFDFAGHSRPRGDPPLGNRVAAAAALTLGPGMRQVVPAWHPESEFRRREYIVSLGQWGPHVMAVGARGLHRNRYGRGWDSMFEQLCASYSFIIVDCGALESHVPLLWREKSSQVLLVIDSSTTTLDDLEKFKYVSKRSNLHLAGTILNKTSH